MQTPVSPILVFAMLAGILALAAIAVAFRVRPAKQSRIRFIVAAALVLTGCAPPGNKSETVAEGVIFSVEYQMEGGRTGGFTRLNESKAVPGRNGSWNIDARGRLTPEFLVITRPQQPDLGPQVIPVHRLVSVQFGDGGIKQVNENQPKPPN